MNLVSERCLYFRDIVFKNFGLFRTKRTVRIEKCPYYRGRIYMNFGLFRTKRTVRSREVSVLSEGKFI